MSARKPRRLGAANTRATKAKAKATLSRAGDAADEPAKHAAMVPRIDREHPTKTRVFVYGTLRRGEGNHRFVARSVFVGDALTRPAFTLYDLGHCPALVAGGHHAITARSTKWTRPRSPSSTGSRGIPVSISVRRSTSPTTRWFSPT